MSKADATPLEEVPWLFERTADVRDRLEHRRPAVFLDFDGTLAPIVDEPGAARMPDGLRDALERLAARCPVAVVSGRDLDDVRSRVGMDGLVYAGSHGFDVAGPDGWHARPGRGEAFLPAIDAAEETLRAALSAIDGVAIERKAFSIAVHHRKAAGADVAAVEDAVDRAVSAHEGLEKSRGKKVLEVRPATDWDKGHAVTWLLDRLGLDRPGVAPVFVGDDVTDEDAFRALAARGDGLAVVVRGEDGGDGRATAAHLALDGPGEVRRFLLMLSDLAEGASP